MGGPQLGRDPNTVWKDAETQKTKEVLKLLSRPFGDPDWTLFKPGRGRV